SDSLLARGRPANLRHHVDAVDTGGRAALLHAVRDGAHALLVGAGAVEPLRIALRNVRAELLEHAHEPVAAERALHAANHQLGEERVLLRKEMDAFVRQPPGVARPSALRGSHQLLEIAVALERGEM